MARGVEKSRKNEFSRIQVINGHRWGMETFISGMRPLSSLLSEREVQRRPFLGRKFWYKTVQDRIEVEQVREKGREVQQGLEP